MAARIGERGSVFGASSFIHFSNKRAGNKRITLDCSTSGDAWILLVMRKLFGFRQISAWMHSKYLRVLRFENVIRYAFFDSSCSTTTRGNLNEGFGPPLLFGSDCDSWQTNMVFMDRGERWCKMLVFANDSIAQRKRLNAQGNDWRCSNEFVHLVNTRCYTACERQRMLRPEQSNEEAARYAQSG